MNVLYIGIGGFFGGLCRIAVSEIIPYSNGFPLATFLVNCIGSVLFALFLTSALNDKKEINLLCTTGFLGSFTTFSAFSYESILLLEQAQYGLFLLYVGGSIILSLSSVISFITWRKKGAQ